MLLCRQCPHLPTSTVCVTDLLMGEKSLFLQHWDIETAVASARAKYNRSPLVSVSHAHIPELVCVERDSHVESTCLKEAPNTLLVLYYRGQAPSVVKQTKLCRRALLIMKTVGTVFLFTFKSHWIPHLFIHRTLSLLLVPAQVFRHAHFRYFIVWALYQNFQNGNCIWHGFRTFYLGLGGSTEGDILCDLNMRSWKLC